MSAPNDVPPNLTPDKDGVYTCDKCQMKVWVSCGGSKNFMQHRGLLACLKASQKGPLNPKASQTKTPLNTIHSYFTKATQGGTSQGTGNKQNRVRNKVIPEATPKTTPPAKIPLPVPGLPHEELGDTSTHTSQSPDPHALTLLASIDRAAQELPSLIPEAEEDEPIMQVVLAGGPEEPSEAWSILTVH
ncbi:hypothetical protein V8E53_011052 [Lactarius tabidus]